MTVCSTTKGQAAKTTSFTTRKGTVIWSETWTNPILNSIVSNIKQTQWHMNKVKKDSRWFWVAVVAGAKKKMYWQTTQKYIKDIWEIRRP